MTIKRIDGATSRTNGTSFHGNCYNATLNELVEQFGESDAGDGYKVKHEWVFEIDRGGGHVDVFTLYDWKEDWDYSYDDLIDWHIGAQSGIVSHDAKLELQNLLG